ncbi:RHS repeat-associated core domain-containing protein, partial [Acinetobacter baumannii]
FRGSSIDELVAGFLYDTDGKLKPYLFHQDALTSNVAITGHNGGAIQNITYGAFGNTLSSTGASPSALKYTGREEDGTGFYYYRARYFDPAIG